MLVQYLAEGYERVFDLRLNLNTGSDGDNKMKGGKLFQTHAAATGIARSPIV